MRGLIIWIVILTAVFFVVGETHGWYIGIPSHTPVFVYKRTASGQASRQTFNTDALPVSMSGKVRHGNVEVKIIYQRPESVQHNTLAGPIRPLFDQTYRTGQVIAIDRSFKGGKGVYTVTLDFHDATGFFRLRLPDTNQL